MQRFSPPLLDRLIDRAPLVPTESLRPSMSIEQLKDAVARDVESLLNSRRGPSDRAAGAGGGAFDTVLGFGLDDFAYLSMSSKVDRDFICRSIERAILNHEPRLRNARVAIEKRDTDTQKLRFSIQALLIAHPLQEPVNFDAVLQTTTRNYAVQNNQRGT